MRRRWRRLPAEVRTRIVKAAARGATLAEIVWEVEVSSGTVHNVLSGLGGVIRRDVWNPSSKRLSSEERVEIRLGLERGWSLRRIATSLGRDPSTVCREVKANGGRNGYRPLQAHRLAGERARRPKPTKLAANPVLCRRVIADLERLWSPQQISWRLRAEFGDDPTMNVSPETIYKSVFVQGRGELRRELAACLRSGRAKRKPQGRMEKRGSLPEMVMISERPAEAADRAVPGHWEGDLILGKDGLSAIGTLVERSTRYLMLLHLPAGRSAEEVRKAITSTIQTLPDSMRRTLTWDQGREMSQHVQFSLDTGIQVYFCDPHSPWQRGSNENTNGLLRQYFPKGTDLSQHGPEDLKAAADSLNGRPRQTLQWMTPSEKLAELVATTG
ncbi:MAG: IS30 family transposase [Acidimicrobiia bacterium]